MPFIPNRSLSYVLSINRPCSGRQVYRGENRSIEDKGFQGSMGQ